MRGGGYKCMGGVYLGVQVHGHLPHTRAPQGRRALGVHHDDALNLLQTHHPRLLVLARQTLQQQQREKNKQSKGAEKNRTEKNRVEQRKYRCEGQGRCM